MAGKKKVIVTFVTKKKIPFVPLKVRKVGHRSKKPKPIKCPICGASCTSDGALRQHRSRYHVGSDKKKQEQAERNRLSSKQSKRKSNVTVFTKMMEDEKLLDVYEGDLDQEDWIDEQEEEFLEVAETERGRVKDYFGNIIIIVPAEAKAIGLEKFLKKNAKNPSCIAFVYVGTCASPGACDFHQIIQSNGVTSSVAKLLMEKGEDGESTYVAYHCEIVFDEGATHEANKKLAFTWESFFTDRVTKDNQKRMQFKYLNKQTEVEEGIVGGLEVHTHIKRARRLGRANHVIIGEKEEYMGIQVKFPLYDENGNPTFKPFTTALTN